MSESISQVTLALELLVTFAGVFLAFMLDRLIDWSKDQRTKKELLRNLASELNRLKGHLSDEEAHILHHDVYDSAVASGKFNLLTSEQLMKLTNVYTDIKNTDYRAISVIIAKESFEQSKNPDTRDKYSFLYLSYNSQRRETSRLIDEVLKEPWLSCYVQKS